MTADFSNKVSSNIDLEQTSTSLFSFEHLDCTTSVETATTEKQRVPLVAELPLSISYNGINHVVMMVSPYDLDDFILGFSLSEALISQPIQLKDIEYQHTDLGIEASVTISECEFNAMKNKRRQLSGRTGCGICGREALESLWLNNPPLSALPLPPALSFQNLNHKITPWQQHGQITGALHAALFVTNEGDIRVCREDVGRHNALDKLLGFICKEKYDITSGFVVITSRCSYELIQKLAQHGMATLASLSAPSSLAVTWARKYNINLIHVLHREAPRVYNRSS
ncbi:formate dehydrogenase accessory sulfurtransferase FdhD [Shewanella surugensis]|uniref:Formate dehydrogenase accessory sulfurtransferase FdhD n=1 Tax=Shewanella surugensis TaxID=212020 RepID=A0ABT0L654_9GAMM|nr:formate dehydrogenase accessory sulfurtransferase FdhD [Shewanella surugensis]MCL1123163.1 formate dehydrogenase accessory sulfurtransferase FdhD [Shewanella surugensis]